MTTKSGFQLKGRGPELYEEIWIPALMGQCAIDLVDAAKIRTGDTVLDVGCGTGVVARRAAMCNDRPNRIAGADINEGMLEIASRLAEGGRMLVETYGIFGDAGAAEGAIHVPHPGHVYARDHFVYWQFSSGALTHLAEFVEGYTFETHSTPVVAGHPRIVGYVNAPGSAGSE